MNVNLPSIPPPGAHHYTVRVYYEDTDAGGVVYHASYLRFAERARTEALRDLGMPHAALTAEHGLLFVVRRAAIDYLAAARLDESLVVVTWPDAIGRSSIRLRQDILCGGMIMAHAAIGLVCVRPEAGRPSGFAPARIPDRWRAGLASLAAGES